MITGGCFIQPLESSDLEKVVKRKGRALLRDLAAAFSGTLK